MPDLFSELFVDYKRVVESDYDPPGNPDSLTFGTYWFQLKGRSRPPKNAIEQTILQLSSHPLMRSLLDIDSFEGAEWWFQEQDSDDAPKEFHTDVDLHRDADGNFISKNPDVASVFYFDAIGGPTVVFGQKRSTQKPTATDDA